MSINGLLNSTQESLQSYQLAIDVTGGNIANVNTPGYSRQRAVFTAKGAVDVGAASAQIGVNVTSVERIYDSYLDSQVVKQSQVLGYNQTKSDFLNRVEGTFAENTGSVSDLLNKYWNAWSGLATNPTGQVERENLLVAADSLATKFRGMDIDLAKTVQDAGDGIDNGVAQVNDYLLQIADLNSKIMSVADDRGESNLLKDNRLDVISELSIYLNINYMEDTRGAVNVFLADGNSLVRGGVSSQLAVQRNASNVVDDIVYEDDPNISLKGAISKEKSGQLAALLEIGDTLIPGYRGKLDALAGKLISEVNSQQAKGYDANGNAGGNFFDTATQAGDFHVSAVIAADVNKIAVSATVNGDGDNARAIAAIKDKLVMNGGNTTANDYYANFVGQVGRDVAGANNSVDQQTNIMQQLTNRREAASGVSLDEEMMNLMKYQMLYGAAGKVVSTVNQLMDTLMQLVK